MRHDPTDRYIGRRFNRLRVIAYHASVTFKGRRLRAAYADCVCDCGEAVSVDIDNLNAGRTTSCGCRRTEVNRTRIQRMIAINTKHSMSRSVEYAAYNDAKERCFNPCNPRYVDYGGRGITMFENWIGDFQAFFDYIGPKPSPQLSLDRIDNNGNYEPGNVRWATAKEQRNNQRPARTVRYSIYEKETL